MFMQKAGDVLKGVDLTTKELGQFWQGVMQNSQTMDINQFKLFCKLCSIKKAGDSLVEQESFAKSYPPIAFTKNPESQRIGDAKLDELKRKSAPVYAQPVVHQPQQPQMAPQYQQQYTSFNQPGQMPSASTSNPSQPWVQPNEQQSPKGSVSYQKNDTMAIQGTNAEFISEQDLISVRGYVETIPNNGQQIYSFEVLKSRVLGFGIETKEASRIWKLVDLQNNKQLSFEAVVCLFYLLAVRKKGANVPQTLAEPLGKYIREKVPPHQIINERESMQQRNESNEYFIGWLKKLIQTTQEKLSNHQKTSANSLDVASREVLLV